MIDVSIKRGTPEVIASLGSMVDSVYRPSLRLGTGMAKEFPHLFHPLNAHNLFYAEYQGKPVSMVGVLKQTAIMPACAVPVASIGSVVTLPEYRGQQLATAVLETVFEAMDNEGQALCLISGERPLYQRLGCMKTGRMFNVHVPVSLPPKQAAEYALRRIPGDQRVEYAPVLASIYRREPYRFQRSTEQMAVLLDALWFQRRDYRQELYVIETTSSVAGYVIAFVTPNKPRYAQILEWAGDRRLIDKAWTGLMADLGVESATFHVQEKDLWMQRLVEDRNWEREVTAVQGTIKTANVDRLLHAVRPMLEELGEWPWRYKGDEDVSSKLFTPSAEGGIGLPFILTDDLNYI